MTLNVATNTVDTVFLGLVTGAATGATGGVWFGVQSDGAKDPFVVVSVASDLSRFSLGQKSMNEQIMYLVRVVANGNLAATRAGAIANAIDVALNFASPTVAGFVNVLITREGSGQRYADADGFYNYAFYYRVFLST